MGEEDRSDDDLREEPPPPPPGGLFLGGDETLVVLLFDQPARSEPWEPRSRPELRGEARTLVEEVDKWSVLRR